MGVSDWAESSKVAAEGPAVYLPRAAGKVIIVTGAGSGIGQATAHRLAAEGGTIACLDLFAETAENTATAINESGGPAMALACDVSSDAAAEEAVAAVAAEHGRIDVLCNIAGIGTFASSHDMDLAQFDKIVAVNLNGIFSAVLPASISLWSVEVPANFVQKPFFKKNLSSLSFH